MRKISCNRVQLDLSPKTFGEMRSSNDIFDDPEELRNRLSREGFLLFKNFFDNSEIQEIRQHMLEMLSKEGVLDSKYEIEEAQLRPYTFLKSVHPKLGKLQSVQNLIYHGQLVDFFSTLLGGRAKPLDFIWTRAIKQWRSETPHCDIVYMGQGTRQLYTTWIPIGDVPLEHGGLMVLERSHLSKQLDKYRSIDVNKNNNWKKIRFKHGRFFRGVHYSRNAKMVQKELGLRWLTTDYAVGDILIFHADLLHATLDNTFRQIRLSIDARFQLESEPMDQRYVGENPVCHKKKWGAISGLSNRLFK